jgi:hypothetical protein
MKIEIDDQFSKFRQEYTNLEARVTALEKKIS